MSCAGSRGADAVVSLGRAGLLRRGGPDRAGKINFPAGDYSLRLPQVSEHNGTWILRENKSGRCLNYLGFVPTLDHAWPSRGG